VSDFVPYAKSSPSLWAIGIYSNRHSASLDRHEFRIFTVQWALLGDFDPQEACESLDLKRHRGLAECRTILFDRVSRLSADCQHGVRGA
jgi:hypothetical protein